MAQSANFEEVFAALRRVMAGYEDRFQVLHDEPGRYSVCGGYSERWKKEIWFGAVELKKSYVSYHLMAVYMCPALLEAMSPELKARMQGKSCFNFKRTDEALFLELAELTGRSVEKFGELGLLRPA